MLFNKLKSESFIVEANSRREVSEKIAQLVDKLKKEYDTDEVEINIKFYKYDKENNIYTMSGTFTILKEINLYKNKKTPTEDYR